jgi:osmotically-inducible protein OsmY
MQREYEYLVARIQEAFANDPRLGILDIKILIRENTIYLAGEVETDEQREALEAVVQDVAPGCQIRNEVSMRELAGAAKPEAIR